MAQSCRTSPGKNAGVGLPFPSPGDLPDSEIKPGSPALQADALTSEPPGKPDLRHCQTTEEWVVPQFSNKLDDLKKHIWTA